MTSGTRLTDTHALVLDAVLGFVHDPFDLFNRHHLHEKRNVSCDSASDPAPAPAQTLAASLTSCIFFRHSFPTFNPSMTFFSIWANSRSWT